VKLIQYFGVLVTAVHNLPGAGHYVYYACNRQCNSRQRGNSTIQFEVLSADATYNDTTGAPNPKLLRKTELVKRGVDGKGMLSHVGKRLNLDLKGLSYR
jgi:hypothetical protein